MQLLPSKFRELPQNTQVTITAQPLWSVPAGLVMSFATLYMMQFGLTSQQVGLISSLSSVLKVVSALFAGWVLDKIGRKLSTVIFDFVSWVIPYYLWATATSLNSFLLAGIFNGFVMICTISYECYHVEDVAIELRMVSLRYKSIVEYIYGFMPLIMGLLINKYSLVPAMRGGYWFGFVCSVLFVVTKAIFLRDTSIGLLKRRHAQNTCFAPKELVVHLFGALRYVMKCKELLFLYIIHLIVMFGKSISMLYFIPFLSQALNLPDVLLGWVPIATTIVSILVTYFVIPSARGKYRYLLAFALISLTAGALVMCAATPNTVIAMVILNILLWGFSNSCTIIVLQAQIQLLVEDGMRSSILSAYQMISMLFMLPCGILGGTIYALLPAATIGFLGVLFLIATSLYCSLLAKGWYKSAIVL